MAMSKSEASVNDGFDQWMQERPAWMQTAAAWIISGTSLDDAALNALADLCICESRKSPDPRLTAYPAETFSAPVKAPDIRLEAISSIKGVNALKSGAELSFENSALTVVYGANGVGKSGFARLLKQACGARTATKLLNNVFDMPDDNQSAELAISINGIRSVASWSPASGMVQALRHVHIFDSTTASEYVLSKTEASYESRKLRFISRLIQVCDKVGSILADRVRALKPNLPPIPSEFSSTASAAFIQKLGGSTPESAVDSACSITAEEIQERIALEAALSDGELQQKLVAIRQVKSQISGVRSSLKQLKDAYTKERISALWGAKADADSKRAAAKEDAVKVFSGAPLNGVGSDSWRLMWEKAREYSEALAYKNLAFPCVEHGARCVLCQQELEPDAQQRIQNFEAYIKGALEESAKRSERVLEDARAAFPAIPSAEDWALKLRVLKISDADIEALFKLLVAVCSQTAAEKISSDAQPIEMDWTEIRESLGREEAAATQLEKDILATQDERKRAEMRSRMLSLKAKEWLKQQKQQVKSEVARRAEIAGIETAARLTKTTALTAKKTELSTSEMTRDYQARFAAELKRLGAGRIPVEPIAISEGKGKIRYKLALKGSSSTTDAHEVLSEGETRIVALSAFLADIAGLGFPTPFVFDDPISSLDQDFEEKVVDRLVELAATRQVIVFTHRLSLVSLLEDALKKQERISFRVETLRRVGNTVGVLDRPAARHKKPKSGFNILKEEVRALQKQEALGSASGFDSTLKAICSDFRILLEKTIESHLLRDIVARFRRKLTTDGKLHDLAKIEPKDCVLIDKMMSKYSSFEHSQSDELPAQLPSTEDLMEDIEIMLSWIDGFPPKAA